MEDTERETQLGTESSAMDRLRDRTDELELIISSLTIFALFSLPGWLFDKVTDVYTHLSMSLSIASIVGAIVLAGTCYGLAACFVAHLMARAYWVGLIGLRTVFPDGINWNKTPGLGPLGRQHYRDTLPDLDTVIQKTDRFASSLFAVISMLTLIVLWFGSILVLTLVLAGTFGARVGLTNASISIGAVVLLIVFLGIPALVYVLDRLFASRIPGLRESRFFVGLVRFLRGVAGFAYPQRLVLPVQLTLQSNTRPLVFLVALMLSAIFIAVVGGARTAAWRNFTLSGEFRYLDVFDVREGFNSSYYEDLPSPLDKLRGWPRIDSFNQSGGFTRLFLPYYPLRDNLVLDGLCGPDKGRAEYLDCLRALWEVSIDGKSVSMQGFSPAERADLGMKGLIGLVPLAGLEPGMHSIEITWSTNVRADAAPLDDRYSGGDNRYVIPIVFSPNYEMPLP